MRTIQFEDYLISYELTYKNVKNINLRIRPDGSIFVSANPYVTEKRIDEFIVSKGKYVINALEKCKELEKYASKPKQYISGEGFKILGRDLRLKVIEGTKEMVESDGIYIFLTVKNKADIKRKGVLINKFINKQCQDVLNDIVSKTHLVFKKYDIGKPKVKIRDMKSRWGSCQPTKGVITLNTKLIEAPRNCIEYVVLHEFCHFIHPNHSKKFYAFVGMLMPDWKERKRILEEREFFISDINDI